MPVGRALFSFEVLQGRLRILPSLDDLDHSCRFVSSDVVADYNVRRLQLVVCQMVSLFSRNQTYSQSKRAGRD